MNLKELLENYIKSEQVKHLSQLLSVSANTIDGEDKADIHLKGLTGSQDAFVAAAVFKSSEYNHFFILSDKEEAAYFQNNLKNILENKDIFFFPDSFKRPQDFTE